jgi:hypothetical protein
MLEGKGERNSENTGCPFKRKFSTPKWIKS